MKKLFTGLPALALLAIETFKSAGQSASSEAAATSPETMLVGVATNVMGTVLGEVLGGQADKHFNQWLEGSYTDEIGVNADVEKCSRDAALKALLFLVKKASEHTDLNDTEKHHLSHLFKGARKKLKEIESLPENDPVLAQNPLTELGEISRILNGSASVKEAQLNEHLVRYVLRLAGLNHETNLLYPRVRDWLQNGLPVRDSPQRVHWFAVYCLAFADNLKSGGNKPAYCQRAREALVNTQLAGVSVRMERIEAFAAAFSGLGTAMQQMLGGLERVETQLQQIYDGLFLKQPFTSIETLVESNVLGNHLNSKELSDKLLEVIGFRSRQVALVGRAAELEALRDFLHHQTDKKLRWWGLTGPGGMGKSRLALELAYEKSTRDGWAGGFVESKQLKEFDWQRWQPVAPTLLMVDYAGNQPEPLREALCQMAHRASTLRFPVRVLLLERAEKRLEDWWERLNDSVLRQTRHKDKPLALAELTEAQLGQVLTAVLAQYGKQPDGLPQLLTELKKIDHQQRPLFAVFLAVVLAEGGPQQNLLSTEAVLEALYKLLKQRWESSLPDRRVPDKYLNLQALATLCYGLTQEGWERLQELNNGMFPTGDEWDEALVNILCPPYNDRLVVNALQPDIFGEYVVLRRLEELNRSGPSKKGKTLAAIAWQTAPEYTSSTISRMATDHPQMLMGQSYLYDYTKLRLENKALFDWAQLVVELVHKLPEEAKHIYQRLRELAEKQKYRGIYVEQAKAIYNMIYDLRETGQLYEAEHLYRELSELAKQQQDKEIWTIQAKMANNIIIKLGDISRFDEAEHLYRELSELAKQQQDKEIWTIQAIAANSIIQGIITKSSWDAQRQWDKVNVFYTRDLLPLATNLNKPESWWPVAATLFALLCGPIFIISVTQLHRSPPQEQQKVVQIFWQKLTMLSRLVEDYETDIGWQNLIETIRTDKKLKFLISIYLPPEASQDAGEPT